MNQELEALGRRAVACEHWQWLPGMLAQSELPGLARVYAVQSDGWIRLCGGHPFESPFYTKTLPYPDLSDPATVGALLGLVQSAYPGRTLQVYQYGDGSADLEVWDDAAGGFDYQSHGREENTLAGLLVAALEAAP